MQTVSFAGSNYNIPNVRGDTPWTGLASFIIAAASKALNTGGGAFTLLADLNLGATFGLVSAYYKSRSANVASAGQIRLANTDTIKWRNGANGADLSLAIAANRLTFEGAPLLTSGGALIVNADVSASAAIAYSKLNLGSSIVNADVAAAAAIALSKLAVVTVSRAIVSDAGGLLIAHAATTATEIGYVNGVTSAIQTQLNARLTNPLAGDLAFAGFKGTGLGAAAANGDAVRYEQMINKAVNILDNGGFEIWQRGTSFAAPADAAYLADRWKVSTNEAANVTVTKETTTIDGGIASMKVVVASAGASKRWTVNELIENYADYRGKTVSVSVRVYSSVATAIRVSLDDNVSAVSYSSYHTGGGGWETLTATLTVSASATGLIAAVGMPANDKKTGTYYFDSAMLVLGSEAVAFVPINPVVDVLRSQRYFYRIAGNLIDEMICPGENLSTTLGFGVVRHPVTMRVTPTATVVGATGFQLYNSAGTGVNTTSVSAGNISPQSIAFGCNVASGLVAGNACIFLSHATTSYIDVSADL